MDLNIFLSSFVGVIIFYVFLIVFMRNRVPMLRALIFSTVISEIVGVFSLYLLLFQMSLVLQNMIVAYILVFMVIGMGVFVYVVGFFGIMTTSIRLELLMRLYGKGSLNCTQRAIESICSVDWLLHSRLNTLVQSGDISLDNGTYRNNIKVNFFVINDILIRFFRTL